MPAFSYAQAARGLVSKTASTPSSGGPSGNITPANDAGASPVIVPETGSKFSWADEVGSKSKEGQAAPSRDTTSRSISRSRGQVEKTRSHVNGTATPSSPEFAASSTTTLTREDDVASLQNASSESTWENKSQVSNPPEKAEGGEKQAAEETKETDGDKSWSPPNSRFQEAPKPAVNVWQKRMEAAGKTRPIPSTTTPSSAQPLTTIEKPVLPTTSQSNGSASHANATEAKELPTIARRKDNPHPQSQKRDVRLEEDGSRGRKSAASKSAESSQSQRGPPPIKNEELWPTPESVQPDERKKSLEKPERPEKAPAGKGKSGWKQIEITPSVVWNTPMHNAHSRRGGRPAGRGGREGREGGKPHGLANSEKTGGSASTGDAPRREKPDAMARSSSPKGKRNGSEDASGRRDRNLTPAKENGAKDSDGPQPSKYSETERSPSQTSSQQTVIPRQNGISPRPPRRQDRSTPEQAPRKDGKSGEPESAVVDSTVDLSQKADGQGLQIKSPSDAGNEGKGLIVGEEGTPLKGPSQDRRQGPAQGQLRGEGRRGSLRGGRNGVHAFHGAPQQLGNGNSYYANGTYSLPRSPTMPNDGYFHQQRNFRGQSRANSVPEGSYGRFSNTYYQAGQLPSINTAFGAPQSGIFEVPGGAVPSSAYALPSQFTENFDLVGQVQIQL
jgi:la-related protein 1